MTERLVEKYRPKRLDDVIGQEKVIQSIKSMIKRYGKNLPHMLFYGNAGTGKTTTAICIARELYGKHYKEYFLEFNASDERGIDVIREKIKRIARTKGHRIIFLDEADALTTDAQHALRRIMETGEGTFILTCNKVWKIIPPIRSRCVTYHFQDLSHEDVARQIIRICKSEGIEIDESKKDEFLKILSSFGNDLRTAINTLDKSIVEEDGRKILNLFLFGNGKVENFDNIINLAIKGDFERAKSLLESEIIQVSNLDDIIDSIYNALDKITNSEIKTKLYYELAKVEYRVKHGADLLIQLTSFLAVVYILPHLLDIGSGEV